MFRLPEYEVVLHVLINDFSDSLVQELESISCGFDLDECEEEDGVRSYHWAFEVWDSAVSAGDKLKHLAGNPNLVLLRVKANYDASIRPISYKDLTRSRRR